MSVVWYHQAALLLACFRLTTNKKVEISCTPLMTKTKWGGASKKRNKFYCWHHNLIKRGNCKKLTMRRGGFRWLKNCKRVKIISPQTIITITLMLMLAHSNNNANSSSSTKWNANANSSTTLLSNKRIVMLGCCWCRQAEKPPKQLVSSSKRCFWLAATSLLPCFSLLIFSLENQHQMASQTATTRKFSKETFKIQLTITMTSRSSSRKRRSCFRWLNNKRGQVRLTGLLRDKSKIRNKSRSVMMKERRQ